MKQHELYASLRYELPGQDNAQAAAAGGAARRRGRVMSEDLPLEYPAGWVKGPDGDWVRVRGEPPGQLPPADELHAIRKELKTLGERENALKALVINDPSARSGNAYCVEILEVTTNRLDVKELRAAYPAETAEHTHPVTTTRVELRGISDDGEIVRIKRGPTQ